MLGLIYRRGVRGGAWGCKEEKEEEEKVKEERGCQEKQREEGVEELEKGG